LLNLLAVSRPEQLVFDLENRPLRETMPLDLFSEVPKSPGVYLLRDEARRVLYVGQSKSLKTRLAYYRNAKAERVPRRILQLVTKVREISWIDCATAEDAELCELEQLRVHQPRFNVSNAHQQNYPFVRMRVHESQLSLHLASSPEPTSGIDQVYGAFKNRTGARRAITSILRLFWTINHQPASPFEWPTAFAGRDVKHGATAPVPLNHFGLGDATEQLHQFFRGGSTALLDALESFRPAREGFMRQVFEKDVLSLREFFETGPRRNQTLLTLMGSKSELIRASELGEFVIRTRKTKQELDRRQRSEEGQVITSGEAQISQD
jgi:hypothetical protein